MREKGSRRPGVGKPNVTLETKSEDRNRDLGLTTKKGGAKLSLRRREESKTSVSRKKFIAGSLLLYPCLKREKCGLDTYMKNKGNRVRPHIGWRVSTR